MRNQHWQDIISMWVGVWLIISPMVLEFNGAAAWCTVVFGLAVLLLAVEALFLPSYLEEWGEIAVGLALLATPSLIGYDAVVAERNSVFCAVLVIVLAIWEMTTDNEFMTWWHEHVRHRAS